MKALLSDGTQLVGKYDAHTGCELFSVPARPVITTQ